MRTSLACWAGSASLSSLPPRACSPTGRPRSSASVAKCSPSSGEERGSTVMSRIGRKPVDIPTGVDVSIDDSTVTVKGPLGTLQQRFHPDERLHRSLHGLTRTLIANMVEGVTKGYEKRLEIVGVGYRATLRGSELELALGFSH